MIVALAGEAGAMRRRPGAGTRLYLSGIGSARAREGAERAVADGCTLLVSWGSAAGLDPMLRCGDVVIARRVWTVGTAEPRVAPPEAVAALAQTLSDCPSWRVGDVAHTASILESPGAKRELRRRTGAEVADMETAAIAEVAERAGVAWAALRVVLDEAGRPVGRSVARSLGPHGQVRIGRLAWEVARSPSEIAGLVELARAFGRVRRALGQAARALAW